jgi:hypothetical protein
MHVKNEKLIYNFEAFDFGDIMHCSQDISPPRQEAELLAAGFRLISSLAYSSVL